MNTKFEYDLDNLNLSSLEEIEIIKKQERIAAKIENSLMRDFDKITYKVCSDNTWFYEIDMTFILKGDFSKITFQYDSVYKQIVMIHESWDFMRNLLDYDNSHPLVIMSNYFHNENITYKNIEDVMKALSLTLKLTNGYNTKLNY